MYTVAMITEDNDIFRFEHNDSRINISNIYLVGTKIIIVWGYNTTIYNLLGYQCHEWKTCKKTRITHYEVSDESKNTTKYTVNATAYVICAEVGDVNPQPPLSKKENVLIKSSNTLQRTTFNPKRIYVDILLNKLINPKFYDNEFTLLTHGIVVIDNTYVESASRILFAFEESNILYILRIIKDVLLANVRVDKEYPDPGCVALFEKDGKLVYYFQCICCTNNNRGRQRRHTEFDIQLRKDTTKKLKIRFNS